MTPKGQFLNTQHTAPTPPAEYNEEHVAGEVGEAPQHILFQGEGTEILNLLFSELGHKVG